MLRYLLPAFLSVFALPGHAQSGRSAITGFGDLTAQARDWMEFEGVPARLLLTIATVRGFPCPEREFRYTTTRAVDTLAIRIDSITLVRQELCAEATVPVTLQVPILTPGAPRVLVVVDGTLRADTLRLEASAESVRLRPVSRRFVHADTTLWLRYPVNSLAVTCASVPHATAFCSDALDWFDRLHGLRRIEFPIYGVIPFLPDGPAPPDYQTVYYQFADTGVVGTMQGCIRAVHQQIQGTIGISLSLYTWASVRQMAFSPKWLSADDLGALPSPEPVVGRTCQVRSMGKPSHQTTFTPSGLFTVNHAFCLENPPGLVCSGHPNCGGFALGKAQEARLKELAIKLAEGEDVLDELLLKFPGHVERFEERNAVAVRSCGKVIAFREFDFTPRVVAAEMQ